MLTELDDTLWHQLPTTFDHVGTSDPRFFDRYWFALYSPDGRRAIQITMGAYRNMNVLDAAIVVIVDGKQHNLRVSRSLNGTTNTRCGPISIDPVEPLKAFQLVIDSGDHPIHGQIDWTCVEPAREEHPHYNRLHGRTIEDYRRFDQIGVANGWIEIDGERFSISDWWSCRDHSWGVRRGMGIPEPVTGPKVTLAEKGHVMSFLFFSTDKMSGHILFMGRGDDDPYTTGFITDRGTQAFHRVERIDLAVDFHPNTRRFKTATITATLDDGEILTLGVDAVGASIAMQGLGYSGGFNDGGGLGVWRGEEHQEFDTWDVSDPSKIVYPDGSQKEHWHRIQPVRIDADLAGVQSIGTGSMTLTVSGRLPDYWQTVTKENS